MIGLSWDGMRPDLISPELTPNLAALAADGITFNANHAVVPTVTRINAATLATGAPSSSHGLPGNVFFAPLVNAADPISVGEGENVRHPIHIRDMLTAFELAATRPGIEGETFVVASDHAVRLKDLITEIIAVQGLRLSPMRVPMGVMTALCLGVERI